MGLHGVGLDWILIEVVNGDWDRDGGTGIQKFPIHTFPSSHRVTPGDPWSVGESCRALCPGVMSPVMLQ